MRVDWAHIRQDFPALALERDGIPLVFLDSGASAQKPRGVIERMSRCMQSGYANVHRGQYHLSETATKDYEQARESVARFMTAKSEEIVFTSNATAGINLIAHGYGAQHFGIGDTVLFSALEHHANIVPWQMAAQKAGFSCQVIPLDDTGCIDLQAMEHLLQQHRVKLVALAHISNVLGGITDLRACADLVHQYGALLLVDGAQGLAHQPVDVQAYDIDFYIATGHKLYGPSGIGILYGKSVHLHKTRPLMGGGDMIRSVAYDHSVYAEPPALFEAGTPPIVEAIGLAAAIEYIQDIGWEAIIAHENDLTDYMLAQLDDIPTLTVWGKAKTPVRAGIAAFSIAGAHPQDIGQMLDRLAGVAVRAGHHCAMPLHDYLQIPFTTSVRASLSMYNNRADIDTLCNGLHKVIRML